MPASFDPNEFLEIFLQEAAEQIEALDQGLVQLERNPGDSALVAEVFRAAHSLKASAASQGLEEMSRLSHALENVFDQVRSGQRQMTPEVTDRLLEGVDALRRHLAQARGGQPTAGDEDLVEALHALSDASPSPDTLPEAGKAAGPTSPRAVPASEASGGAVRLRIVLAEDCAMPAARAWLLLRQLGEQGELRECHPSLEDLQEGSCEPEEVLVALRTATPAQALRDQVAQSAEVAFVELVAAEDQPSSPPSSQATLEARGPHVPTASSRNEASAAGEEQQTVRVQIENIDALVNLMGELVINRTRLSNLKQQLKDSTPEEIPGIAARFEQITDNLGQIVTELQERVLQTRMVPVEQLFLRFPRLVRDAARREGKQVDLRLEGSDTELDSSLIQSIVDPLKHLLRNAVGHGIERPPDREAAGKPEEGCVRLRAYQESSSIVIEVEDDGAGIDPERLRAAAVRKELMTPSQAAALSDRQVLDLMFLPGFSTAQEVSDVSGRGVGMDVVKSNIEKLGGQVTLESVLGEGTKVRLSLPLTLAIIRALLVTCGGQTYALPLPVVERVLRAAREEIHSLHGGPALTIGEQVLPLVDLAEAAGLMKEERQVADKRNVVMVTAAEDCLGLQVEEILGNEELVIQPLGKTLQGIRILSGVAILGDGQLALIVDVPTLVRDVRERRALRAALVA